MGSEDHLEFLARHALEQQRYDEAVKNLGIPAENPDDLLLPPQQAAAAVRKRTAAFLNEKLKKPVSGREVERKLKTMRPLESEISLLRPVVWQAIALLGKDVEVDVATREFCHVRQDRIAPADSPMPVPPLTRLLTRFTHLRFLVLVTELMSSIGSPDAVTDVLNPSQLTDMALFMKNVEQADGRESLPAWPASLGYLSGAKVLYGHDRKYLELIFNYCSAVMAKVKRLAFFYAETHEIVAEEDGPSAEAISKFSNVAACGGAYYVNQGRPTGSVRTNTLDWKQDDEFPDDVCNKKVGVESEGRRAGVRIADWIYTSFSAMPPTLISPSPSFFSEGFCLHKKGKHGHHDLHVPVRRDSRLPPHEAREYVMTIITRLCVISACVSSLGRTLSLWYLCLVIFAGRRHVYAALKRFFVNEQGGADFTRVYYDYACSLSEVGQAGLAVGYGHEGHYP